jgi:cytoskeletal protein CcmA (bactofilin family)
MFTPARNERPNPMGMNGSAPETVIARGVRLEGDFKASGNVVIEGEVVGTLTCGGHLTVGSEATIHAAVHAQQATISGCVEGDVAIAQQLEVKASAAITGDISAQQIAVEMGAALRGQIQIGTMREGAASVVINTPATALEETEA